MKRLYQAALAATMVVGLAGAAVKQLRTIATTALPPPVTAITRPGTRAVASIMTNGPVASGSTTRSHHLRKPPRGYEWRNVDGDYVLGAVATGVIADLLLNSH